MGIPKVYTKGTIKVTVPCVSITSGCCMDRARKRVKEWESSPGPAKDLDWLIRPPGVWRKPHPKHVTLRDKVALKGQSLSTPSTNTDDEYRQALRAHLGLNKNRS